MFFFRTLTLAAASVTALAASAYADEIDTNGFHVALLAGFTDVDGDFGEDDTTAVGFSVGYERDFGSYFFGVETSFQRESYSFNFDAPVVGTVETPVNSDIFRLLLRGGIHRDRFAIYGVAGLTHFDADTVNGAGFDQDISESGYTVGLGTDYYVEDNVFIGLEVLRNDYDDINLVDYDIIARLGMRF